MRKITLIAAMVAFAAFASVATPCPAAAAAEPQAVRQDASVNILPGDGFAPGWKKSAPPRRFVRQDLFNHINGGAELFLEFGFDILWVQSYSSGRSELTAEVYLMDGPASALGLYLQKSGKETPFAEIPARNSSEDAQAVILKGRYFLQIDNFGDAPASRKEMGALASAILARIPDEKAETALRLLPPEGRVAGSERLIRGPVALQPVFTFGEGDILQMEGRIYAALADYKNADGSTFSRLIVEYPDAAAAHVALAYLKSNLDSYLKITGESGSGFSFIDFQKKRGTVDRRGAILDIAFRLKTE